MSERPGTGWEEQFLRDFPMFRRTANSGAVFGDGDATSARVLVECKDGYGDAITFPYAHLLKIQEQARAKRAPHWMRVMRNDRGDKVVSMNYELAMLALSVLYAEIECDKCGHKMEIDW